MDDRKLFDELAKVYNLGQLRRAERRPTRAFGFPGLIVLEPKQGNRVLVKQVNSHSLPVDGGFQRDVSFHARCASLGIAAPRPVLTPEGLHGSVEDLDEKDVLHRYNIFTAEEFVDGKALLETSVSTSQTLQILSQAGKAAALLRVASRRLGNWDISPHFERPALRRLLKSADNLNAPWARNLEQLIQPLSLAVSALPLNERRPTAFAAPLDFAPKDAMVDNTGQLMFTDWERSQLVDLPEPLFFCTDPWIEWASSQDVSAEQANNAIGQAFRSTLARHVEPPSIDSSLIPENFLTQLTNFHCDAKIALSPNLNHKFRMGFDETAGLALQELREPAIAIAREVAELDRVARATDRGVSL